jgi:cyclophilin family peptidyl-prolyl cis-trans isomerase
MLKRRFNMGKIKKIKAERKRLEVERQLKKAKSIKAAVKIGIMTLFAAVVLLGSFYGYKFADSKYDVGRLIAITTNKIKETLQPAQGGSQTQKEEKMERKTYDKVPEMQIDVNKKYTAVFETSKGNFEIELYPDKAPKTVNNFVFLAREKFYDGLIFHRIIKDFMVQGGDPQGTGMGGPGYKFEDEFNDVKLTKGVLAMANSGPNTNGSQFFIVTAEATDWLDGKHTAFGRVISGLEAVMSIQESKTGENDKPEEDIVVKSIAIIEK